MFLIIDVLRIKWRVVKQNLHAIRPSLFQTTRRPVIQQIGQPARTSLVVSSFFIREQQAGILSAAFRRRQSPLGIEQDGTGVRRKNLRYQRLELFHHGIINFAAFFFGKRFLQRAALIHGRCGDDAAIIGDTLKSIQFSRSELHKDLR